MSSAPGEMVGVGCGIAGVQWHVVDPGTRQFGNPLYPLLGRPDDLDGAAEAVAWLVARVVPAVPASGVAK